MTSERITAIEEQHDRVGAYEWSRQDGFQITTTEQVIWLGISNGQDCCEQWGYLLSEDDLRKFVGTELRGITVTDTNRTTQKILTSGGWSAAPYDEGAVYLDAGDAVFVDIETDRGTLQFVAYNAHNGYYGHTVTIVSRQLKLEKDL